MKRLLLLFVGIFACCSLQAQEPLKAGTYYIQNVASGGFLSSGANWGTRSVLSKHGVDVKVTGSDGTYTLVTQIQGANKALNPADGYMDQSGTWTVEPVSDGIYTIFNGTNYLGYTPADAHPWVPHLTYTTSTDDNTRWRFWTKEELVETMKAATKDNPVDATFFIQAPDFLIGDYRITGTKVWGNDLTSTGGNVEGGSYLHNCSVAEKFNTAGFDITQTLKGLPNGIYSLSVQAFYRYGSQTNASAAFNNGTEKRIPYLYADDRHVALPSIYSQAKKTSTGGWNYSTSAGYVPNFMDAAAACFDSGDVYLTTIKNIVVTDGTLKIGIQKPTTTVENDWTCFDNFTLMYYGADMDLMRADALKKLDEYDSKNTTDDTEFSDAISAQRAVVNAATDYAEIEAALEAAKQAYQFYATKPEPTDKPFVVSDLIMENPSFSEGISGWESTLVSLEGYNQQWFSYSSGSMSLLEAYAGYEQLEMSEFSLKQTVSLSPGMYRLKLNGFYRYGVSYNTDLTEEGREISNAFLFAGDKVKNIMRLGDIELATYPNSMSEAATSFTAGNYMNNLIFDVTEPTTMELGVTGEHKYLKSWFILGPVVLEKINDQILEAEEVANFANIRKDYVKKWNSYKQITNQAVDHSAFDEYLATTYSNIENIVNKKQLEEKDAEVWNELVKMIKTGTPTNGQFDITLMLNNPTFAKGTEGWNVKNGLTWGGTGTVEVFNKADGKISQIMKGMPAGTYTLKVQGFYRPKSASKSISDYEAGLNELAASLFLNDNSVAIRNINDGASYSPTRPESDIAGAFNRQIPNTINGASSAFDANHYWNILRADVSADGDLELGVSYSGGYSSNWLSFDNFRLYYGVRTNDVTLSTTEKFPINEDTYANVTTDIELQAGQLNPLCLPFDIDASQFASAWTILGVVYDADADTLTGKLAPIYGKIEAGTPCFVRVNENTVLSADDVILRAAKPDSILMTWEGGTMVGYYGKQNLTRSYRMDDGETMVYSLAKMNVPGYRFTVIEPSTIFNKAKTITFEEIDYNNIDITVNLENVKAREFLSTAKYFTTASSTIIANYNIGPPARRDQPNTVIVPVPLSEIPCILEYSQTEDFKDATTIKIAAKTAYAEIANLIPQQTYYYHIYAGKTEVSKGTVHTEGYLRMIKAPTVSNIRDLGGWLTLDGNRVNYGKVYRGGEMNAGHVMNEADRQELRRLGIGAEVDLRQDADFGGNIISTSALGSDVPYIYVNQSKFADDALKDDVDKYKAIFPFILENLRKDRAVYFHCIWGADRTGAMSFLLDGLVGMTMDQMYKNYELTTFSIAGLREKTGLDSKFEYINTMPGKTLQERFFNYWADVVGIPQADLLEYIEIMTNGQSSLVTAIKEVERDNPQSSVISTYYSIDGRRLEALQPGINIIRMSDGTVKKVFVK